MFICKHCERECKNHNSLRNHERLCKKNVDRQEMTWCITSHRNRKKSSYRNQFTKALELGLEKPEVSNETKKKLSDAIGRRTKEFTEAVSKKVSATINKKVREGEWHTSLARNMHIEFNGVDLHGKWELKYAQYLEANSIKWERNKESFPYEFEGKEKRYTPDFYLPDLDEYIEIKGYKTQKDEAKWSQFPKNKKLIILFGKDLKKLNISL